MKQNRTLSTSARKALLWLGLVGRVLFVLGLGLILAHYSKDKGAATTALILQILSTLVLPNWDDCRQIRKHVQSSTRNTVEAIVAVLSWIAWSVVLMYGLVSLFSGNRDAGVKYMMTIQGLVWISGCALTFFLPISKFWALASLPLGFILPIIIMGSRASMAQATIDGLVKESEESGIPFQLLIRQETARLKGEYYNLAEDLEAYNRTKESNTDQYETNVNELDVEGISKLHYASSSGNYAEALELIESGADIDILDENGASPLHYAAYNGHADIVELLIESGADIDILDDESGSPLHYAKINGHTDIVELLIEAGAISVDLE